MDESAAELSRAWLHKAHSDQHTAHQIGNLPDGHLDVGIFANSFAGKPVFHRATTVGKGDLTGQNGENGENGDTKFRRNFLSLLRLNQVHANDTIRRGTQSVPAFISMHFYGCAITVFVKCIVLD